MTDQQRADLCAREGYPLDTTPFLDSLAASGMWFDRAYTPVPVCLPARICALTGRWGGATRVRHNSFAMEDGRVTDTREQGGAGTAAPVYTRDIFDVMREQGYRTALVGKNHSHLTPARADYWSMYGHSGGRSDDRNEQELAFDEFLRATKSRAQEQASPFPLECQLPYRIVRDSIGWIDRDDERPFFLWLSIPEPHNPYQVCEPYFSMFPPDLLPALKSPSEEWKRRGYAWERTHWVGEQAFADYDEQIPRIRSSYHGMLRLIDDQLRRFVEYLDHAGVRENTLLVCVSDHGDFVGEYGLVRKGPELPEVLSRVPMFWNGPGITPGGEAAHPAHVSLTDLFPTICEAIGAGIPPGVQGRSLWPLLRGDEYPAAEFSSIYAEHGMGGLFHEDGDEIIDPVVDGLKPGVAFDSLTSINQSGFTRMVRRGDWKLVFDAQGRGRLYNLAEDPVELHDLYGSSETAEIERELLADLLTWTIRVDDPLPLPNGRYRIKLDPRNWWTR